MKYVGVRSCKCEISKDSYLGSSKVIPPELYETCIKTVIKTFRTRIEAVYDEVRLHEELDIAVNKNYYNQVKQTSEKFDQQGTTKESHKHIARMAEKLKGRSKSDYVYLELAGKKKSSLRGNNRTKAQVEGHKRMANTVKGVKNPDKGNTGVTHHKYRPWYYINPEGSYTEVYDSIRNYVNTSVSTLLTTRSIAHVVCTKPHTPLLKGKLKGYVFGYLDNKPEYLTQENILLALQVLQHLPVISPNKVSSENRKGNIENITGKK